MNGARISLTDWQSETGTVKAATMLTLEEAFAAHHRLVYRYALSLTREPGLAEDVVQEVFVRLHQHLEAAQREGLLRAWLLRVTANVAGNVWRGRCRTQAREESFGAQQVMESDSPETELLRQVEIDEVRRALAQQYGDWQQEKAPTARTMKSIELPEEMDKRKQEKAAAAQKTLERGGWPMEEGRVNDERKKLENLGKQMIEGVEAVGTRSTFTIPAGEVGNIRPIVTVEETWYSPELDMMVLTKRTDPRSGETIYRLTNLNRNEPDRALFEVPADYTVTTASKVPTKIKPREEE